MCRLFSHLKCRLRILKIHYRVNDLRKSPLMETKVVLCAWEIQQTWILLDIQSLHTLSVKQLCIIFVYLTPHRTVVWMKNTCSSTSACGCIILKMLQFLFFLFWISYSSRAACVRSRFKQSAIYCWKYLMNKHMYVGKPYSLNSCSFLWIGRCCSVSWVGTNSALHNRSICVVGFAADRLPNVNNGIFDANTVVWELENQTPVLKLRIIVTPKLSICRIKVFISTFLTLCQSLIQ